MSDRRNLHKSTKKLSSWADRIPGLFGFPMYQEMLAVCVFAVLVIVSALAVMLHLARQLSTAENIPGELLMGGIHTSFPR